jgi:hypothetical protein
MVLTLHHSSCVPLSSTSTDGTVAFLRNAVAHEKVLKDKDTTGRSLYLNRTDCCRIAQRTFLALSMMTSCAKCKDKRGLKHKHTLRHRQWKWHCGKMKQILSAVTEKERYRYRLELHVTDRVCRSGGQ